jgi:hypothetical protein
LLEKTDLGGEGGEILKGKARGKRK